MSDCIIWPGKPDRGGYGRVFRNGQSRYAHRVVFEEALGRLLARAEFVCHTCDIRNCVNLDHLYLGSAQTNRDDCLDRRRASFHKLHKSICKNGHPMEGANLVIKGTRHLCRQCMRTKSVRAYQRKKLESREHTVKAFTSKIVTPSKVIDFELDGTHYEFLPPKTSTQLVALLQIKGSGTEADIQRAGAMFSWFAMGLNRDHESRRGREGHTDAVEGCGACKVQMRLEDPDDALEIDEVMEVISWLMGESAGRPTT